MDGDEKQSIAKDVKAAYAKTHFLLDDDQQLRIFVSIYTAKSYFRTTIISMYKL